MITLNGDKWEYAQSQVTCEGIQLSQDGYNVDTAITEAIARFPTPANHTDLRAFFGLVNQLAASTNTLASSLGPLRPLLSTKNDFMWLPCPDPTLSFFDPTKPTRLCTDTGSGLSPPATSRRQLGTCIGRLTISIRCRIQICHH